MFNCGYPVSSCVGGEIFNTENSKREKLYFLGGNEFVVLKGGVGRHDVLIKKIRMWGRGSKGRALGARITVRMDPSPTLLGSSVNDFECFG